MYGNKRVGIPYIGGNIVKRYLDILKGWLNKKSDANTSGGVVPQYHIVGGKYMANVCKFYKKNDCAGKTCTNGSMTAVKFCPFVKDGKFQNQKASCTCKGYQKKADAPNGIAGVYVEGQTSPGKFYVKFKTLSGGVIIGKLVDHCGCESVAGTLFQMRSNGDILLATHVTTDKGLNLDSDRKLKVVGTF
jgi:hypothetical protein